MRAAIDTFVHVDVLVNNAGQGLQAAVDEIDPNDFRAILDINVIAPLIMMQAVLPVMRQQGSGTIVNASSGIAFSSLLGSGAYPASKVDLGKLSAVARSEPADAGIVVSTMYPFVTSTEFPDSIRAGRGASKQLASSDAPEPQRSEQVADAILEVIHTGAEQADLVPTQFGCVGSHTAQSGTCGPAHGACTTPSAQ